jgi:hypothetical protein
MISRAHPVRDNGSADPIPRTILSKGEVQRRPGAAMSRRELFRRGAVITAEGITTMALNTGPLARSSAGGTVAATASGTALVPEYARFLELVGTSFIATPAVSATPAQRATLTLEEVILLGDADDLGRPADLRETPFALRFVVREGALAPSGIFRLRGADNQAIDAFIHQVGMRAPGGDIRYEAVFN